MEYSKQSDAEVGPIRTKLRNIQRKIKRTEHGDAIENPTSGLFKQFRNENDESFEEVRHDRDNSLEHKHLDLFVGRSKNRHQN